MLDEAASSSTLGVPTYRMTSPDFSPSSIPTFYSSIALILGCPFDLSLNHRTFTLPALLSPTIASTAIHYYLLLYRRAQTAAQSVRAVSVPYPHASAAYDSSVSSSRQSALYTSAVARFATLETGFRGNSALPYCHLQQSSRLHSFFVGFSTAWLPLFISSESSAPSSYTPWNRNRAPR